MHRHGYKGRKLSRERDQRRALLKGLSTSLVLEESIETTLPKAKEVIPFTEKLITKAKKGDLHNRRQVIATIGSVEATNKLFEVIAPNTTGRDSGHLTIEKTRLRKGDGVQMARVSFIDDIKEQPKKVEKKATNKKSSKKSAPKKTSAKKKAPAKKEAK